MRAPLPAGCFWIRRVVMTHCDDPSSASGDPVPPFLIDWREPFRGAFSSPTWRRGAGLVMGAGLAPGKSTVSACLRVTGRALCETFSSDPQVLNRARWDPRDLSRRLGRVLVARLLPGRDRSSSGSMTPSSAAGARVSRRAASSATRCVPAMAIASRPAGGAGSASCGLSRCPGRRASGPCPS